MNQNSPETILLAKQQVINSFQLSIYRALLGETTPLLRAICFNWPSVEKEIKVFFYYDSDTITGAVQDHYSCVMAEASCNFGMYFNKIIEWNDFEVIPLKYPKPIPLHQYAGTIYLRKEPFEDPKV